MAVWGGRSAVAFLSSIVPVHNDDANQPQKKSSGRQTWVGRFASEAPLRSSVRFLGASATTFSNDPASH